MLTARLPARGDVTSFAAGTLTLLEPYAALDAAAQAVLPAEYDGWGTDGRTFNIYFSGADAGAMRARVDPALATRAGPMLAAQLVWSVGSCERAILDAGIESESSHEDV